MNDDIKKYLCDNLSKDMIYDIDREIIEIINREIIERQRKRDLIDKYVNGELTCQEEEEAKNLIINEL